LVEFESFSIEIEASPVWSRVADGQRIIVEDTRDGREVRAWRERV
jgi:hypothetical protein